MTAPIIEASRLLLDPTPSERVSRGRALRRRAPRRAPTGWKPRRGRPNIVDLLERSNHNRLRSLTPIRHGRMLASPFAFLRGMPDLMAFDLSPIRVTGINVQICGDAHLGNFGGFATPERNLVFDLNDFDETIEGPWEWDVLRLVASVVLCGRLNGVSDRHCRRAVIACAGAYREQMREYAHQRYLDIWYERVDVEQAVARFKEVADDPTAVQRAIAKGQRHTHVETLPKLAEQSDHGWVIRDDPPLIAHKTRALDRHLHDLVEQYKASLQEERRVLLERYRLVDLARKVVGVGSIGTRCYVALLLGTDGEDPLFLQIKEAGPSVLAPYLKDAGRGQHGERVVTGQRVMQAASDLFLGWTRAGRIHYYVRQLRDMKFSVDLESLGPGELTAYADLCGQTLARAHACSGDAASIGGYLGKGTAFDQALAAFAMAYANQTERDFATFTAAVKAGRIEATPGI